MRRVRRILLVPFPSREEWRGLRCGLQWALLGAALCAWAYPPMEWWWMLPAGLAGIFYGLPGLNPRQGAWHLLLAGTLFYYLNLTWLNTLVSVNPGILAGVPLLALYCALFLVPLGWAAPWLEQRGALAAGLGIPALWVAAEFLRAQGGLGFPWVYLGHSLASHPTALQVCALAGVWPLSFGLCLGGWLLGRLLRGTLPRRRREVFRGFALPVMFFVLLWGAVLGYGGLRMAAAPPLEAMAGEGAYRVGLIQPGIDQATKMASYMSPDPAERARLSEAMRRRYEEALGEAMAGLARNDEEPPALWVLPESAITDPFFNLSAASLRQARAWARLGRAPLLIGANRFELDSGSIDPARPIFDQGTLYNSAWLIDPGGSGEPDAGQAYDKMQLVPFGETGSIFNLVPGLSQLVLGIYDFGKGRAPRVFRADGPPFGVAICFESCFPRLFRRNVAAGAQWMVVITNDAWYKQSSGARRHQTQALFRAAEMRRPLVRVANTGISSVVDAWGRSLLEIPLHEGAGRWRVAALPRRGAARGVTPFMRPWGDWYAWLCLAGSMLILGLRLRAGRRGQS